MKGGSEGDEGDREEEEEEDRDMMMMRRLIMERAWEYETGKIRDSMMPPKFPNSQIPRLEDWEKVRKRW